MANVEPFAEFFARTAAASPEQYGDAIQAAAERWGLTIERVAAEFDRMKAHILHYYQGVIPVHSFLDPSGRAVDCVPFEQQPTVRAARAAGFPVDVTPPRPSGGHGNCPAEHASLCPAGSVPLLRITLDRMLALGTLDNFFRKSPEVADPSAT